MADPAVLRVCSPPECWVCFSDEDKGGSSALASMYNPGAPLDGVDNLGKLAAAGVGGDCAPAFEPPWWWCPFPLPLLSISAAAAPIIRELRCAL